MNKSWQLVKSDLYRYIGKEFTLKDCVKTLIINHSFRFSFFLRLSSHKNFFIRNICKFFHYHYSLKYGIQIPTTTKIGYGLFIGHHFGLIVHPSTIIGNNCNLSQFSTIGATYGKAAEIGNNVYIGPGCCIVENIKIGDNVTIGAGSVVVKSIIDNVTVAGNPAKIISKKVHKDFIQNPWETK